MLNPFGKDYTVISLIKWLSYDPSLPWAIIIAIIILRLSPTHPQIKKIIMAFFFSFLPLSFWIWDIPFTNRVICHYFHDGKLSLFGETIRTRHFYVLGILIFLYIFVKKLKKL